VVACQIPEVVVAVGMAEPESGAETSDIHGAYPRLSGPQLKDLAAYGMRRRTRPGDVLFREGDPTCDFFVVLEGKVAVVEGYGTAAERVLSLHGPGRFLGELSLLTGEAVFVTAVVREPGEVLAVPLQQLRLLVGKDPVLGDLILRAYLIRRSILIEHGAGFRIVGSRFSPDTRRLREFAARNRLPHRWIDLEEDKAAEMLLRRLGVEPDQAPVVLWRQQVLRNPSNAELAHLLGLRRPSSGEQVRDLVIVGAGPAGLAAAVYGASEGLSTTVLDAVATGGQAGTSSRIENYLGFPVGISGGELAERAEIQAERFGAQLSVPAEATMLHQRDGCHLVELADGEAITGWTVLIAASPRGVRGGQRPLRRDAGGGADVPQRSGGRRGRGQLRRTGGHVPRPACRPGPAADPSRRPRPRHVTLPGRPDRAGLQDPGAAPYRGARARWRARAAGRPRRPGQPDRRAASHPCPDALRLHRRRTACALARGPARLGRQGLHPDRP
jgi:thioredoxin reductase (NADPH)